MHQHAQKNNFTGIKDIIDNISKYLDREYDVPIFNICTDGDGNRRRIANSIMKNFIPTSSYLHKFTRNVPHLDTDIGHNFETFNFDAKHLSKRTWNSFRNERICVGGVTITKTMLQDLFEKYAAVTKK